AVGVVDEAIRKGVKNIWFQKDVDGPEAVDKALNAGMNVVVDTCPSIEGRMRSFGWRM
ncbi:CoA-binding protein, partial [Enteractinococcus helveticum]|uniref:CoA-binding protein n=1 Tax=Enteractinococcus helveticum TaxID=1837282 RepID=UPI0034E9449B